MADNYWDAMELYRTLARDERLRVIARKCSLGNARISFLKRILEEAAFENEGDNSALASEIMLYPELAKDTQIKALAAKAAKDALFVLDSQRSDLITAGLWEETEIPGIKINRDVMADNLYKRGVHLIHAGIGSGKTSDVLLPLARTEIEGDTALVVVPNTKRAYELAELLGWEHYHRFGEKPDDIKLAIKKTDRLVICAASLGKINYNERTPYRTVYLDEITEVFKYAQHAFSKRQPYWGEALKALPTIIAGSDVFYAFSADIKSGFTHAIMDKICREYGKAAFYYRTNENWGQYQHYEMAASREDLVWDLACELNRGKSAWVFCDLSDYYGHLSNLAEELKSLCPGKKIEYFDTAKIKDEIKGQAIRELGVVEYVKTKRRNGELDAIIFSPVAQSQYSILFDEDELDLIFDFSYGYLRSAGICHPADADQGLGRARQTKRRKVWIAEHEKGIRLVDKNAGAVELAKLQTVDMSQATAEERIFQFAVERFYQHKAAGQASRKWLFKELVKEKGATVTDLEIVVSPQNRDRYLEIATNLEKSAADRLKRRLENSSTKQLDLLNRAYRRKERGWGLVERDGIEWDELTEAVKVDRYGAETLFRILLMDEAERASFDRSFQETYYQTTFELIEPIFAGLFEGIDRQKLTNLFDWYVNGDSSAFFEIDQEALANIAKDIGPSWEYVRRTLEPPVTSCGTITGFLRMLGNLIGLTFTLKVDREERTLWKAALFAQYHEDHIWVGDEYKPWGQTKVAERYEYIANELREKLNSPGFTPTHEEQRMMDTMKDIIRVEKKPLVSREVVNVFRHYELHKLGSPLNRNPVSNALSEKSAS